MALIFSHRESLDRSVSCFEGAGCAALTGSEAGNVSISPASSRAWVSMSARAAFFGSSASLSGGAGLNFSAIGFLLRGQRRAHARVPEWRPQRYQGNRGGFAQRRTASAARASETFRNGAISEPAEKGF